MRRSHLEVALLAVLAYVPVVLAAPGRVLADTKLGLAVDPGRLVSDAVWTWDARQLGGWVPHQQVGYLWPSGPWFWVVDVLSVPDWIAQRLWVGTILLAAGLGARWCARHLGLATTAALVAALLYQCTAYVLPYISRTSVLLPPWAGLGWLVGLTLVAARQDPTRPWPARAWPVAAFALVVATIGGINATAMVMIAPAPLLVLAHLAARGELGWRRAGLLTAALGGASLAVSTWWLSGLAVQGRYGAQALAYSEALESTAFTSSAPEVLRGLGYWLFYVRDHVTALTTASAAHQEQMVVIAASWLVVLAGLAGLVAVASPHRRLIAGFVLAGVVLAVGAHPVGDPAPLWQPFAENSRSTIVLALRSSTRATPMIVLGLALGAGLLVEALRARRTRLGLGVGGAVLVAAAVAVPALWTGGAADPALARDDALDPAWREVARELDRRDSTAVLQLPGIESAAFRWGYTVDTPLAHLGDTPVLTREWLPLGSPGLMDVLYALDDRFQNGTIEPSSVAPLARLLGADVVLAANDVQFERFDSARPEPSWAVLDGAPGLGAALPVNDGFRNVPTVPMVDEAALLDPTIGQPLPQLALLPVDEPLPAARVSERVVLVSGSGDGIVDAAAAGLVAGDEVVVLSAAAPDVLEPALVAADLVIVTDSARERARHWRSSQDVWGYTEGQPETLPLVTDPFDHRLPAFPGATASHRTVAEQRGPVRASATAYGTPSRYWPEFRPAMAADGDLATSWRVGGEADPRGERLRLDLDEPVVAMELVQHQDPFANRWISAVRVHLDTGPPVEVRLDDRSRTPAGQPVELAAPSRRVEIEIVAVANDHPRPPWEGDPVGLAEVRTALGPLEEVVRPPIDLVPHLHDADSVAYVLTRLRADPTERRRDDPERALVRQLTRNSAEPFELSVLVRLSPRADDALLDAVLGAGAALADRRMPGGVAAAGRQALDGDPTTAWFTPFEQAVGASVLLPRDAPDRPLGELVLQQRTADVAVVTEVLLRAGGEERLVPVPPPDVDGRSTLRFPALPPGTLTLTIAATDGATTIDRFTGRPVGLPTAIAEVEGDGLRVVPAPDQVDLGCRDDLLSLDGQPLPLRVSGSLTDLRGQGVVATPCDGAPVILPAGASTLRSSAGVATGLDVDRVVLRSGPATSTRATPVPVERGRASRQLVVPTCSAPCWVVQGEGWSDGWSARLDGRPLGEPLRLGPGMGGWLLPPSDAERVIELRWTPQRWMWAGLGMSAVAVIAALAIAALALRRRSGGAPAPDPCTPPLAAPWQEAPLTGWWAVPAATLVAALVIAPLWGLAVGVAALIAWRLRRAGLLGLLGVVLLAAVGAYLVVNQLRHGHPAGFGWPMQFDRAHQPALAGVVLVALSTLTGPSRTRQAG